MKIGVFDSGVGGKSVARAIEKSLPEHEIIYVNDAEHLPYGTKSPDVIFGYVKPILENLVNQRCQVIVVACNTVSTTLIGSLREVISVPLVAMEPMVKPAAELTKSKVIAVCATPATLASDRYRWLKDTYAQGVKVIEPDCSKWADLIENDKITYSQVQQPIENACDEGADVIVLGCTHYHWIEELVRQVAAGRAEVLQPEIPVIEQLKRVIAQLS